MSSKHIKFCVRFALTKGEGEWPNYNLLTNSEKADLRKISTFYLDLDSDLSLIDPELIKSCTIIYDGITNVNYEIHNVHYNSGLSDWVADELISGKPEPIIEFELVLNKDTDLESINDNEFNKLVRMSYYKLQPKKAEEAFYAEDWNGYTSILTNEEKKDWIKTLKKYKLYSGKKFSVKDLIKGLKATKM